MKTCSSLFKGSQKSGDPILSSSDSVWSIKCSRDEAPFGSVGSGAGSHRAVVSLVESHPLDVLVA